MQYKQLNLYAQTVTDPSNGAFQRSITPKSSQGYTGMVSHTLRGRRAPAVSQGNEDVAQTRGGGM